MQLYQSTKKRRWALGVCGGTGQHKPMTRYQGEEIATVIHG
ncbi:hypothetical protein GFS31_19330 [Leptolyngbya sp. BL0902]|nr:hypothetical protein GFS31_19330 [Leptolyngbya sp. BL0902]